MTISWRLAKTTDDERVVAMSLLLHTEDPGPHTMEAARVRRTLEIFRREPHRGRVAVGEHDGEVVAYALLVPFWSNELGGSVCEVDELYVKAEFRSRGVGRALFTAVESCAVWDEPAVAIALGVTSGNARARSLYERVGFRAAGTVMVRLPDQPASAASTADRE